MHFLIKLYTSLLLYIKITNSFKQTDVKISFRTTNTIQQQLNTAKHRHNDPSGRYKLKCNTCNKVYVGQSGRAINIRFKEYIRYIRSNNSTSAYAAHILETRHEYETKENTIKLLKPCRKGKHMDCWEALYMQTLHHKQVFIGEQQIGEVNPLFQMATITYTH
jgi:hypothetical protein